MRKQGDKYIFENHEIVEAREKLTQITEEYLKNNIQFSRMVARENVRILATCKRCGEVISVSVSDINDDGTTHVTHSNAYDGIY